MDRNWIFAIPLVQDKPNTYVFKKTKGYLLRGMWWKHFDIVHVISAAHVLQALSMMAKK